MKKLICVAFMFCTALGLMGCSSKPSGLSDKNYEIACKVLDTVDAFLDGDMDYQDANDKLDVLSQRFDTEEDSLGSLLRTSTDLMSFDIIKTSASSSAIKDVETERDDFAKRIGK